VTEAVTFNGWTGGIDPPKLGIYWVTLEREPGATHVFFYDKDGSRDQPAQGWETPHAHEVPWLADQSARMRQYGPVVWWREADCPPDPYCTAPHEDLRTVYRWARRSPHYKGNT
jgi:hypothetical protein